MAVSLFRRVIIIASLGILISFEVQAASQSSTETAPIIEKIIQAYGGHSALEQVKAVRHTGTIKSYRLDKTGKMQRSFQRPDKLRVELIYPNGPHELRITTPAGAWRDGRPAPAAMHTAMKLQAARFQLPMILPEKTVKILGEADGKLQLAIKLTATTSLEVFVDRKTWHIVRSVGRMNFQGMEMAFIADYSDFRKVDNLLFAFREDLTAMGRPTGIAILDKIEINPDIDPENFKLK